MQESSAEVQPRHRTSAIGRRETQSLSIPSSASSASFQSSFNQNNSRPNIILDKDNNSDDRYLNTNAENRVTTSHNGLTVSIKKRNAASAEKWGRLLDPSLRDRQRESSSLSISVSSVDASLNSKSIISRTLSPNLSIQQQQQLACLPAPVSAR